MVVSIWVRAEAVDMPNDQRAQVLLVDGGMVGIKLLGTGKRLFIESRHITAVEFQGEENLCLKLVPHSERAQ